ncbi:MAG TPA: polyprenyl diphosphate synthase [Gemmatimonadales bacterium]|jgi:undecaprenyl diphosphate synthase
MLQSPFHVAIIMDGNGRWATSRGRVRYAGHRAGAEAVRRIVTGAQPLGIDVLTLYAFSSDNWERPITETSALMRLFSHYLRRETATFAEKGIKLSIIGQRTRLPNEVRQAIDVAESATAEGTALRLRIAIDYSARDAIVIAAHKARQQPGMPLDRDRFAWLIGEAMNAGASAPDVDLLIRTGGEQRLSDFLLWECAYAELMFSRKMWPEWTAADLAAAVADFQMRERRFGALPDAPAS